MTLRAPTRRSRPRSLVFDALLRTRSSALILSSGSPIESVTAAVKERIPDALPLDLNATGLVMDMLSLRQAVKDRLKQHPVLVAILPMELSDPLHALLAEVIEGEFVLGARVIAICPNPYPNAQITGLFVTCLTAEDVVSQEPASVRSRHRR